VGDAKIQAVFDFDLTDMAWDIDGWAAIIVQNATDTLDQTLQRGLIELIGSAKTVDHLGFDVTLVGMADIFGECVVADGGAVLIAPLCGPKVHAHGLACTIREL